MADAIICTIRSVCPFACGWYPGECNRVVPASFQKPGKEHMIPDALSRLPKTGPHTHADQVRELESTPHEATPE